MPSGGRLQERATNGVLAVAKAYLPAEMTSVWAQYAVPPRLLIPQPEIKDYLFGARAVIFEYPTFLAWWPPSGARLENGRASNVTAETSCSVVAEIAFTSDSEEALDRMEARFSEAIYNMIFKHQNLDAGDGVGPRVMSCLPVETATYSVNDQRGRMTRSIAWRLEARNYEDF